MPNSKWVLLLLDSREVLMVYQLREHVHVMSLADQSTEKLWECDSDNGGDEGMGVIKSKHFALVM